MNPLKRYKIGFVGLSIGIHDFSFDIGADFFDGFGTAAFEQGQVNLLLTLEKSNTMLTFDFQFTGVVMLECDRCLELFPQSYDLQKRILVKFGESFQEPSDEIVIIPSTESHFDISQYVYEFLHLGLPLRRVHPEDQEGQSGCDPVVMERLNSLSGKKPGNTGDAGGDSPWDALKSLTFN